MQSYFYSFKKHKGKKQEKITALQQFYKTLCLTNYNKITLFLIIYFNFTVFKDLQQNTE